MRVTRLNAEVRDDGGSTEADSGAYNQADQRRTYVPSIGDRVDALEQADHGDDDAGDRQTPGQDGLQRCGRINGPLRERGRRDECAGESQLPGGVPLETAQGAQQSEKLQSSFFVDQPNISKLEVACRDRNNPTVI